MHLVFVYGTLKKGFRNHYFLENALYLGAFRTETAIWDMSHVYDHDEGEPDHYPTVFANGNAHITGQLYKVDATTLSCLDELEELGVQYDRQLIMLETGETAYMYINMNVLQQPGVYTENIIYDHSDNSFSWVEYN